MQHSLPILPKARYSCSLAFITISGDFSVVIVNRNLSGSGIRPLYTFSFSANLGCINLHALPTQIPLSSPLITILNPALVSPWVTPSTTGVVYNNPINPRLAPFNLQLTPLQPPELGGGIGFRITVGPGRYIDLSLAKGTATSRFRVYRVRAQVVFVNDCTPTVSPGNSPRYHTSCRK
jgi:hypothetical protein